MRIAIKDFTTNPYKYLNDLPVTITKYGKPFAVISPARGYESTDVGEIPSNLPENIKMANKMKERKFQPVPK